ncbi:MAG: hypothetical protein ACREQW_25685 [Candidatus Binatia bacterium]
MRTFVFIARQGASRWSVIALFFLLHVVLVFPVLTPNLQDIGPFDEGGYINGGRRVAEGGLPILARSPLTEIFYALTYIPVRESPYWLIHSCTLGRIVLFGLLWLSSYQLAKRISIISSPLIMAGLLVISPALTSLVENGSHALFTALSTFALGQLLSFHGNKETKHLWAASILVGLAVLTRNGEGTVLSFVFITFSVLLGISARRVRPALAACITPLLVIVGSYIILHVWFSGGSQLRAVRYSYMSFEQGHGWAYSDKYPGRNPYVEGQVEARRLFGTPEQNQHSIINAIRRNPLAYIHRIPRLASKERWVAPEMYGGPVSVWFFLLALGGSVELIRKKQWMLLGILVSWPLYSLLYILLVFQPAHLLFPFPVVFCLASIGLCSVVSRSDSARERYLWSAVILGLIAMGIVREQPPALILGAVVLLVGLWIMWIVMSRHPAPEITMPSAFIFLFCMMLLVQGGFPLPKVRKLGIAPDERAGLYLKQIFREGAPVAAYAPLIPRMAKMTYVPLAKASLPDLRSDQDLRRWMIENKLEAIYVDSGLRKYEPVTWALIEGQIGKSLEVAFTSEDGKIQLLRITESAMLGL